MSLVIAFPCSTCVYVRFVAALLGLVVLLPLARSQITSPSQWSNLRTGYLSARIPLQELDSLTVAWPLMSVADSTTGKVLPPEVARLYNHKVYIDTALIRRHCADCRTLRVRYRVLPANLGLVVRRLDTAAIRRPGSRDAIEFDYTPYEPPSQPWETGTLTTNGAYTRGLSFGNNQNLVFNSNLNLQLNGKLGNDIELQAALSDNSVPLQPEGTTRQIQEFDRIFIQLKRKNASLIAGDYDLARPYGYFSNYFKRLQGAAVDWQGTGLVFKKNDGPSDTLSVRVAAALSRGKFARQLIQGQEGNQGPYRLQGAEGERFIIVLAGTEKVFMDGQLLTRGLNDDYVIDYNLAEITFTPKRLITKDIRIIVEFEYAVQTYTRSTTAIQSRWSLPRSRLYFNYYSEQDSRNGGGAQELSESQRAILAQAGDNLLRAFAPGVDTVEESFDPSRIYYKAIDTAICGQLVQMLVYTTNSDSARFTARFTEVPAGTGNYVQALNAANGRVFRYSAPDPETCTPTGNFEPIVRLIAPEQRQLITLGGEQKLSKGGLFTGEIALSRRDINRFSPLGDGDNGGVGTWLGIRQPLIAAGKPWQVTAAGQYEYTAQTFRSLNPYRPPEFTRDWNLDTQLDTAAEHWGRGGVIAERKGWGMGRYEFSSFVRRGAYQGLRHFGHTRLQRNGFEVFLEINTLNTQSKAENTRFSRPKFDISKTFFTGSDKKPLWKIGVYGERERNERRFAQADTLQRISFWYDLGRIYLQRPEALGPWQWLISTSERIDYAPKGNGFQKTTTARDVQANGTWTNVADGATSPPPVQHRVQWQGAFRRLSIDAPELTTQEKQETYLGRIDYSLTAWKNALQLNTGYELGSGQSPRLEFNYLRVNPGEGQYTWVDRNRDSILQLDEMEVAVFSDQATYVRIAVTTTDYIRTNNVLLNQGVRLDPRLLWGTRPKGWKNLVRRLSLQSNVQLTRRALAEASGPAAWNPFSRDLPDTVLMQVGLIQRHVFFINRANPAWDASATWSDARNRTAQTTGFELRRLTETLLNGRVNLGKQWSAEADVNFGFRESDHQLFNNRDYAVQFWEAGPRLTWLPGRSFRLVGRFTRHNNQNTIGPRETATQTEWQTELTWNPAAPPGKSGFYGATSLRAQATFNRIRYSGEPNTPVAYAMLEGLQNGENFLWSLTLDRQLSKTMQLSIQYEGRKTGVNRPVHIGRAQVRALF